MLKLNATEQNMICILDHCCGMSDLFCPVNCHNVVFFCLVYCRSVIYVFVLSACLFTSL